MPLMQVQGKSVQGIAIGDKSKNILVPTEAIISMYAVSNVWLIGPTFDMLILDSGGALLNPMPSDGSKLFITMGDSLHEPTLMQFMVVGSPTREATGQGAAIRVSATLNKPKLYHGVHRKAIEGTSSDAIKQIAKECDLETDNTVDSSSSDKMKWLPMGRKYGYFLADIASHGWFGDESAASVVGVTLDGKLVYRHLAKAAKAEPVASFYYGVDPPKEEINKTAFVAHDFVMEDMFTSGLGLQGYNASRTRFLLDGTLEKSDKINVTQGNERVNVSQKTKDSIGVSRVFLGAPDCGNTHTNYDKAAYQNMRYRATFGRQISVVVPTMTEGVDLLDPVKVFYVDPKTREATSVTGVVTAKIRAIVNGFYIERFNVAFQGEDGEVI